MPLSHAFPNGTMPFREVFGDRQKKVFFCLTRQRSSWSFYGPAALFEETPCLDRKTVYTSIHYCVWRHK
uniref:Uncharacterized protein n=1 Tax=Anguilla anguilla TaxID=7936 RepID=A0A0E9WIH0_ANGAN